MKERVNECCLFRDKRSIPSIKEHGKTYQIDNSVSKIEIGCIKIDGCVFEEKDGIKCDYLFEVESKKKLYYVELKGSDIIHAINQVRNTIQRTKDSYKGWQCAARIIIGKSKVPLGVRNTKEYQALFSLVNQNLEIKENIHREIL